MNQHDSLIKKWLVELELVAKKMKQHEFICAFDLLRDVIQELGEEYRKDKEGANGANES